MYSIVPCSNSYESRFFIFRQFWAENVNERGICWEKMFSYVISRSSKVNQGHLSLLIFLYSHWLSCGQKWWEYENVLERYAHICSQLGNLGPFGPTVTCWQFILYKVIIAGKVFWWCFYCGLTAGYRIFWETQLLSTPGHYYVCRGPSKEV